MFSYIITHRGNTGPRLRNLKATVNWIKTFNEHDIEIIVIEQDVKKSFDLGEGVNHVLAYNGGIFSRAWGFNVGAKIAKGEWIIFGDTDVVHTQKEFNAFLHKFSNEFKQYAVVGPYKSRVIFLNDEDSNKFNETFDLPKRKPAAGASPLMGGVSVMTRECYDKSGGWDEFFVGWGGEDCSYREHLVKGGFKLHRDSNQGYHLYHDRDKQQKTEYRQQHARNRKYYFDVYKGKTLKHIELNRYKNENIGDINKYGKDSNIL